MNVADKKLIYKSLEDYLRAYKSYQVGIKNFERISKDIPKLMELKVIVQSIDSALETLNDVEKQFIVDRYFNGKSIVSITLDLGYSESSVHVLRRKVLDKLSISLINLFYMERGESMNELCPAYT